MGQLELHNLQEDGLVILVLQVRGDEHVIRLHVALGGDEFTAGRHEQLRRDILVLHQALQVNQADLRLTVGEVADGTQCVEGDTRLAHPLFAVALANEFFDEQDGSVRLLGVDEALHMGERKLQAVGEAAFLRPLE